VWKIPTHVGEMLMHEDAGVLASAETLERDHRQQPVSARQLHSAIQSLR
jgi:hypothetical protein